MEENLQENRPLVDEVRYKLWDKKARAYIKEDKYKSELLGLAQKFQGENWQDYFEIHSVRFLVYRVFDDEPMSISTTHISVNAHEILQNTSHGLGRLIEARAKQAITSLWDLIERKHPKHKRP